MKKILFALLVVLITAGTGQAFDGIAEGNCGTFLHVDDEILRDFRFQTIYAECGTKGILIATTINVGLVKKNPDKDLNSVKIILKDQQGNVIKSTMTEQDKIFPLVSNEMMRSVYILSQQPVYNLIITY